MLGRSRRRSARGSWRAARGSPRLPPCTRCSWRRPASGNSSPFWRSGHDWPLVGQLHLAPALGVAAALHGNRLAAAPLALERLGVRLGQEVILDQARFTVRAALISEPGQVAEPALLGPPVLIGMQALAATRLSSRALSSITCSRWCYLREQAPRPFGRPWRRRFPVRAGGSATQPRRRRACGGFSIARGFL